MAQAQSAGAPTGPVVAAATIEKSQRAEEVSGLDGMNIRRVRTFDVGFIFGICSGVSAADSIRHCH